MTGYPHAALCSSVQPPPVLSDAATCRQCNTLPVTLLDRDALFTHVKQMSLNVLTEISLVLKP